MRAKPGQLYAGALRRMHDAFFSFLQALPKLERRHKQLFVFVIDLALLIPSLWTAYSLRIGQWVLWDDAIAIVAAGSLALMIPIFLVGGVYNTIFRYAGFGMMRTLARAFVPYTIGMALIFMVFGITGVPRTLGILQPLIYFMMIASVRIFARFLLVDLLGRRQFGGTVRNVLIYGAGKQGQQLAASLRGEGEMNLVGYIDDDHRLDRQKLDGRRVYWTGRLAQVMKQTAATDVLLALPRISRSRRREIIDSLSEFSVNVSTLPPAAEFIGGRISVSDIRPLDIEDLLGRQPVSPNELLFGRTIVGKVVLVTGAGGSIGSELCRQIARNGAARLILFEVSEFALYSIEAELAASLAQQDVPGPELVPVLGSILDRERLRAVIEDHGVDTIFHAAAYKHVPLVELNPVVAVRNNIVGTYEVVSAACEFEVSDTILISTDKAVRPTNVMGATKRASEQILQAFAAEHPGKRLSMVRFGNVLGSSGSVVPLFRRQIIEGGPVTLTHRDVRRYFMTIPEAASLVIQAGGLARGGEVFVLDMGEQIRIADLARTMIRLSGLTVRDERNPNGDIAIQEVGLRDGEKLYEELLIGSDPQPTVHPQIMMATEHFQPLENVIALVEQLGRCNNTPQLLDLLKQFVPEFEHRRDNSPAIAVAKAMGAP